jgi:hypothetical protein
LPQVRVWKFSAVAKTATAGQLNGCVDVSYQNAASAFYERMGMVKGG